MLLNNGRTLEMINGTCYDIVLNYITALSAILVVVNVSSWLTNYGVSKPLGHMGRNSMYYYPLTAFVPDYCKLIIGEAAIIKIVSRVVAFPITYAIVIAKSGLKRNICEKG